MELVANLWTGRPAPPAYIDLILCRDVYHCTPSALAEEDAETVAAHLACIGEEQRIQRIRQNRQANSGK